MDAKEAEQAINVIMRQNQENEQLCQQLQEAWAELRQARAWAAAWKRAAKGWRGMFRYLDSKLDGPYSVILKADNQRLRKALERIATKSPPGWTRVIARKALDDDRD